MHWLSPCPCLPVYSHASISVMHACPGTVVGSAAGIVVPRELVVEMTFVDPAGVGADVTRTRIAFADTGAKVCVRQTLSLFVTVASVVQLASTLLSQGGTDPAEQYWTL